MITKYIPLVLVIIVFETIIDFIRTKSIKIALITCLEMLFISGVLLGYVHFLVGKFFPHGDFGGGIPWRMALILFLGSGVFILGFLFLRALFPIITKIHDAVVVQNGLLVIFRKKETRYFEEVKNGLLAHLKDGRVKKVRLTGPSKAQNIEKIRELMT